MNIAKMRVITLSVLFSLVFVNLGMIGTVPAMAQASISESGLPTGISKSPLGPSLFSCTAVTQIPQSECEALVALYTSTGGSSWTYNTGWLQTNTPCSWYGVTCDNGHVANLDLASNKLSGNIPSQLGNLTNLRVLYLYGNKLSGSIPAQLGSLTQLTDLELNSNQLSGSLPVSLENITQLGVFHFNNTALCEPDDTAFQAWLSNIKDVIGTSLCSGTFSISGSVTAGSPTAGLANVTVAMGPYNTTTGDDGSYTISLILPGAKGSLKASLPGYTFKPASISVPAMTTTLGGKNFTATPTPYTISGKVTINNKGLKGVTLQTTSDITLPNVVTNSSGDYSITTDLSANHIYTVTPLLTGYSFNPTNFVSPNPTLSSNLTASFAATLLTENISGTVSNLGTTKIQIRYGSGKNQFVLTDGISGSGAYTIPNLPQNVSYTIKPISPLPPLTTLFHFNPTSLNIPAGNGDKSDANFDATPQVVMSGNVSMQGKGIRGVTVSAATVSTFTDSHGNYSLWVPESSTSITPTATHPFFTFTDVVQPVTPSGPITQNWSKAEVTITGKVTLNGNPLSGVVLTVNAAKGAPPLSTPPTGGSGTYSLTVHNTDTPNLASFVVTPALLYYTFSPNSQVFRPVSGLVKNFTASPEKWNVSGVVTLKSKGLSGVEIDATITPLNGTAAASKLFTNSKGAFTFTGVPYNASVTLSAKKYGYTFNNTITYPITMYHANRTDQNFSATALTLDKSISGTITLSGTTTPLASVLLTLTYKGDRIFTTKTAKDGTYSFSNLYADSGYVVIPTLSKYTFSPTKIGIDLTTDPETGHDFSATHVK